MKLSEHGDEQVSAAVGFAETGTVDVAFNYGDRIYMIAEPDVRSALSPQALLRFWVAGGSDRPAVRDPGTPWVTYRALSERVDEIVDRLRAAGVRAGQRVATAPPNGTAGIVQLLSIMSVSSCMPLDTVAAPSETADVLRAAQVDAVLVDDPRGGLAKVAEDLGVAVIVMGDQAQPSTASWCCGDPVRTVDPSESLLLSTSGTSGHRKLVPLSRSVVHAGASASAQAYGLTPEDCRLNIMPLHHVQGTVGSVIASLLAGGRVTCVDSLSGSDVLEALIADDVTWFSATPSMHRAILASGRACPPSRLRFVRCGSAALTSDLRGDLEIFYGVPVVESYGMSEAHQIASTSMTRAEIAPRLWPTGSRVAMLVDGAVRVRGPAEGEIIVKGPNVVSGYLDDAATCERFHDGWFRTGDLGHLHRNGSFEIVGRLKEMINRGGEKIAPGEIEEALTAHSDVVEALAFGIPDPILGEAVAAIAVPRRGTALDKSVLFEHLKKRLGRTRLPSRIVLRPELPVNATGKVQRSAAAQILAEELVTVDEPSDPLTAELKGRPTPAHESVESCLRRLWCRVLPRADVGLDQEFLDVGGNSLSATMLVALIEDELSVRLSVADLFDEHPSIAKLAVYVESRSRDELMGSRSDGTAP